MLYYVDWLLLSFSMLLGLFISFSLIQRYLKVKVKVVVYLFLNIFIGFLADLNYLYAMLTNMTPRILEITTGFFGILSGYFLIYFLETYKPGSKSLRIFSVMSFLTGGIVVALILELVFINSGIEQLVFFGTGIGTLRGMYFLLFFAYISILAYKTIQKIIVFAIDKKHKQRLRLIQISIIISYLGTASIFTVYNILMGYGYYVSNTTINVAIKAVAITFLMGILLGYVKSPRAYELHPVKIYKLMIISKTGLPIATYDFTPELNKEQKTDNILVAGAITALRSFMEEISGEKDELKALIFQSKVMEIEIEEEYIFILFADEMSEYLKNSLKNFAERYKQEKGEKIKRAIESGVTIELTSDIIEDLFGK